MLTLLLEDWETSKREAGPCLVVRVCASHFGRYHRERLDLKCDWEGGCRRLGVPVPPGTRNLSGAVSRRLCGDHIAEASRAQPGMEPSLVALEAMAGEAEAANRWSQFTDGSLNGRTLASWVGDLADVHGTTLAGAWAFVAQHAVNTSLKATAASMSSHYSGDPGVAGHADPRPRFGEVTHVYVGDGRPPPTFCQTCGSPGCYGLRSL